MTEAKKEALELYEYFLQTIYETEINYNERGNIDSDSAKKQAKKCALFCVEQIINSRTKFEFVAPVNNFSFVGYWLEVKKEIELIKTD